jgi:hypothetical protein
MPPMRAEAIFGPVCILALWTGAMLVLTGVRRIRGVTVGRIPRGAFKFGDSPEVPPDVLLLNRNLMNLLEMPVLFYVVCIGFYVTRNVQPGVLALAWLYVLLRIIHSLIHVTTNRIIPRLISFALSNFVLVALWLWFVTRVL